MVAAYGIAGVLDPAPHVGEQVIFDQFPDVLPSSSRLRTSTTSRRAGELLIADRVDVELVAGDVLGLGARGGLEVDDRQSRRCPAG